MSISGDRIKKLREARGISQIELADRIGINNSVLSRIESGKRAVEETEINAFADFFEVSGDYILGRSDKKTSKESNMSFLGGPDNYTQDEIDEMEAALLRYREMKKRASEQVNKQKE